MRRHVRSMRTGRRTIVAIRSLRTSAASGRVYFSIRFRGHSIRDSFIRKRRMPIRWKSKERSGEDVVPRVIAITLAIHLYQASLGQTQT